MLNPKDVSAKVRHLRLKFARRDVANNEIYAIREGRLEDVAPDLFNDQIPKSIIANHIDIAARDTAEMLAPLPAFNCSAANMASDAGRKFADRKTTIINHYMETSGVQAQSYSACDRFVSYGMMATMIEPDFENKIPRIVHFDPRATYPEFDRFGRLVSFTRVMRKSVAELCRLYPEYASMIAGPFQSSNSEASLELYLYHDKDQWLMMLPERGDLPLTYAVGFLDEPTIIATERPGATDVARGQFDDVAWIQVAKNRFAMMAMEAAEKSVEAPIALPYDVQELAIGPDATIRSNTPEAIRRVHLQLEPAVFQEGAQLSAELMQGSRYPESRTGNVDASVITGQGIRALQGGFDSSIAAYQEVLRRHYKDVVRIALKMDERLWGTEDRDIRGQNDGVPYSIKYRPARDIDSDYTCDVTYGFAAGIGDPNRALVALLQMRGDKLISRDFTRRQFPFGINVTQEESKIEVEELREALLGSIAALAQSIPVLAQQGQDPGQILAQLGQVIQERQKGKTLEEAIGKAFAAPATPDQVANGQPGQAPMEDPAALGGGGGIPGAQGPGMGGGAPMDLMSMLSGLNMQGNPTGGVSSERSMPI